MDKQSVHPVTPHHTQGRSVQCSHLVTQTNGIRAYTWSHQQMGSESTPGHTNNWDQRVHLVTSGHTHEQDQSTGSEHMHGHAWSHTNRMRACRAPRQAVLERGAAVEECGWGVASVLTHKRDESVRGQIAAKDVEGVWAAKGETLRGVERQADTLVGYQKVQCTR
eukprot:365673-Chlamydomonas_euryale.AAC.14